MPVTPKSLFFRKDFKCNAAKSFFRRVNIADQKNLTAAFSCVVKKWLLLLLSLLLLQGCISRNSNSEEQKPAVVPIPENAVYKDPARTIPVRLADLLSLMTLEEKAGQMALIARDYLKREADIAGYFLGGLLSGGGSAPPRNTPAAWVEMYDRYQSKALATRLGIPLIYGIDAVHGHNTVYGAVIFPHHIGMGCTRNPQLVEQAAAVTALEVAATGIDWNFSPCIAVPRDERWGRTYEGFGETPELAEIMGAAEIRGLQGSGLTDPQTTLACAKHYVGDGGTLLGKDRGNAAISEEELRRIHLPGYVAAVKAGVGSIMVSFSSWNGIKLHEHNFLITDILKSELGFNGLLVSDWAAQTQLAGSVINQVVKTINAGLDMIMVPDDYQEFIISLKTAVEKGQIPLSRIDDAVSKILSAKFQLGLFEKPLADRSLLEVIGSQPHRDLARQCVRESVVLLKNREAILPLAKNTKSILVAGKNADDLGAQCGGWTMTWQGMRGRITVGTTILEAIRATVSAETRVIYSPDGKSAQPADVAILVLGEDPYAEGLGDRTSLYLSESDKQVWANAKQAGIPVVVILISGRPLVIPEVAEWDALLAAWLPGSEALGVTDILFGDYNPTGKLSHTWPAGMEQIPINYGDEVYDPLFAYGFGLSYE